MIFEMLIDAQETMAHWNNFYMFYLRVYVHVCMSSTGWSKKYRN